MPPSATPGPTSSESLSAAAAVFAAVALRLLDPGEALDVIERSRSGRRFGDFSDWVNVFKPGKGTITIYENTGGTRGKQLYQLKGIPLTPGAP